MCNEKSHLTTLKGTLSPTAIGYMNTILDKRRHYRKHAPRGLLGALGTIIAVFKNANSFFFQ